MSRAETAGGDALGASVGRDDAGVSSDARGKSISVAFHTGAERTIALDGVIERLNATPSPAPASANPVKTIRNSILSSRRR